MPTDTTSAQDRILEVVHESQEASVEAVRRWSEGVASVFPRLPELFYPDRPEQVFGFAAKLWASQWEFATRLVEAAAGPVSEGAREGGQRAASQASRAAAGATPKS